MHKGGLPQFTNHRLGIALSLPSPYISTISLSQPLVLQRSEMQETFSHIDNSSRPIAEASMHDNGNFVLFDSHGAVTWQSFDHPTNSLLPGQHLPPGYESSFTVSLSLRLTCSTVYQSPQPPSPTAAAASLSLFRAAITASQKSLQSVCRRRLLNKIRITRVARFNGCLITY